MPESPPEAPWLSLMSDGFKLLFGFLLGLSAALAIRVWQSRIDEHSQRYDDVRGAILQAADISTCYWLKVGDLEDRRAEARLVGLFQMINGLTVELASASGDSRGTHAPRLVVFNDLTTGGQYYEVDERPPDNARAMAVQLEAADLILYFQEYRRRHLTLWNSLRVGFVRRRPAG
ncbi:MAG: hypothetical protein OXN89_04695 [Bryobacterales bacterium]|nr:hypothetical protein [Bryobacterales bacterium]